MVAISRPRVEYDVPFDDNIPTLPHGFDVYNGQLYRHNVDLLALAERPISIHDRIEKPVTPMYLRYLPALRQNYADLNHWFAVAKAQTGYPGKLTIAYASKANPTQPVVSTLLQTGAAYECSSNFDVEIVRHAARSGWLDQNRMILANGFKIPAYAQNLIRLRDEGFTNMLPILDDIDEIAPFADSGLTFNVGLRSRTDANYLNRFGLNLDDLIFAAEQIAATDNLTLTAFHAMQTVSASRGLPYQTSLVHSLRAYAHLHRAAQTLNCFNLGGGLPGRNSDMDFQDWMIKTLGTIMGVCDEEDIPTPDLIIESGRYMVQDHACKMFRVLKSKTADDGIPFYVIDGSIMSNFPDAWALGDQFMILPVNHWNGPFQPVRLSGLTCDPDDIYPTHQMADVPIMLPVDSDGLVIGFFDCGAYQETLGGKQGAKHCLLPEGSEVIVDGRDGNECAVECSGYSPSQSVERVLGNLGYVFN